MARPLAKSIEMYLDPETEQGVRLIWKRLADHGLSSLHQAAEPTRVPHVSMCVVREPSTFDDLLPQIRAVTAPVLGATVQLSDTQCFAPYKGRCVLYLAVQVPPIIHRAVRDVVGCARAAGLEIPHAASEEQWVPHCTLSRRIRPDHVDDAMAIVRSVALPVISTIRAVVYGRGAGIPALVLNQLEAGPEVPADPDT